jgi:hypothetical protein
LTNRPTTVTTRPNTQQLRSTGRLQNAKTSAAFNQRQPLNYGNKPVAANTKRHQIPTYR